MRAVFLDFATVASSDLDAAPLASLFDEWTTFDHTPAELVRERIDGADFVILNKVKMTDALIREAKSLRFIGLTATGVDNVDVEAAAQHDVAVCNIRRYCTRSVVEHVFAVILHLARNVAPYDAAIGTGKWQQANNFCLLDFPIRELSAMTIGIIGFGELGAAVARTAEHFGMDVLIARRPGTEPQDGDGRVDFDALLERCNIVSLHCPLTDDTRNLIGAAEIARMRSDAILVNTARGALVDAEALVEALTNGRIAGAAIDVLPEEPPVNGNPLLDYRGDNLLLTPHIAWATLEARQNAIDEMAANVRAFLEGKRRNRVD